MNQNSLVLLVLNIVAEKQSPDVIVTSEIITQFVGYSAVFHFENETKDKINSIVSNTNIDGFYLLNNYNNNKIIVRPSGYKFLHVILLKNYTNFDKFTKTSPYSLEYIDIVLFILERSRDFTLWKGNTLEKAGGLFILDTWNLSLYTVCFFCGKLTKTLRKIDGLSIEEDNRTIAVPVLAEYTNKFDDFNKHVFAVGYNIYKPLFFGDVISQKTNVNHTVYEGIGIERELLVAMSEKLNFVCNMIPFSNYKSPWAAVVSSVANNEIDFAISGVTLTLPRANVIDFTTRIRTEPYAVLYCLYEDPLMSWKYIMMPFQPYVWLTLAGTLFVISFLSYKLTEDISLGFFIKGWIRLLFEQSIPHFPSSAKTRWALIFFMTLWFMLAIIINFSYKSKLTSSLINSKATEFNTIDELVDKGYDFQMNDFDSTVLQSNLRLSKDPKFMEVLRRSNNETAYCKAIFKTIGHKVAMIDEMTLMQNKITEECRPDMSIHDQDQMRLLRDDLFPSSHAWPMRLNSPFRISFNLLISRLDAAGLFEKWTSDFTSLSQVVPRSHQRYTRLQAPSFNLSAMLGPAIIWSIGMSLAIIAFIMERIFQRHPGLCDRFCSKNSPSDNFRSISRSALRLRR